MLDVVAEGGLLLLRGASRYSLSPPGVLVWAFGMGLRIICVWAVTGGLGGVDVEDVAVGRASAFARPELGLYLSRSRRELFSRRAIWDFC